MSESLDDNDSHLKKQVINIINYNFYKNLQSHNRF